MLVHLIIILCGIQLVKVFSMEELNIFYSEKVHLYSNGGLRVNQGEYGYEVICNKEFQVEDNVMVIQINNTISSFTTYNPYTDYINQLFLKNNLSEQDKNLIRMIVNINLVAYDLKDNNDSLKDYLLYQLNLTNDFFDYLPYWNNEFKMLLKKISGSPIMDKDLLYYNDTLINKILFDIKVLLTNKGLNHNTHFLTENGIKASLNLIFSKAFIFSLKGYKIIAHLPNISQSDLEILGYILIPGADIINHKKVSNTKTNVQETQIKYEKGNILIKASSPLKQGNVFTISYNLFLSFEEMMKTYGFAPIESLNDNMVYSSFHYKVNNNIIPRICYALSACILTGENNIIQIVEYTNLYAFGKLTLHRLNNWQEEPIIKRKMVDIYRKIKTMTHSNITEGMALSDFGHEYYGTMLYKANFQIPIEILLSMYNENENKKDLKDILLIHPIKNYNFNYSNNTNKRKKNIQMKFREILKFCLIEHHVIALNMRETINRLHKTLNHLFNNLLSELISFFN